MDTDRWRRIERVFQDAADLTPAVRREFLSRACDGDEELRKEVESLLAADAPDAGLLAEAIAGAVEELPPARDDSAGLVGRRLGPYTVTGVIGKGGMGAVYRADREGDFRMQVAVKLLKRGTETEAALSRFRAERQILAGLQHPNIARLLDGGATETGLPYFVMEHVDGKPLLEYTASHSVRQRLELFRSVCSAVQYAHQNLIVHRDIKPANILVTPEGLPKLLDFGIAKLLDPAADAVTTSLTMSGAGPMTPDYASPEQLRGEPVTTAADIYSLGAVLYELLTGQRARRIDAWSPAVIEKEIILREPPKPSSIDRRIDPDLDNIVLMALRNEPARRYASVEQFSEDIRLYLEGRPVRARRDTLRYRAGKFLRRHQIGVIIVAAALIGITTGVLAIEREGRRAALRFQQVRKLANTVLYDLNGEIESLAGSTKARELLVRTSLEYLNSLAAEVGNDPSLRLEVAAAFEKIGDVQGNPVFSHLGHPRDSLESYRKAREIAEGLRPSGAALELLARAHYKSGCVYNWALSRYSEAQASMRQAVEIADSIRQTTSSAYRVRAEANGFLGDIETSHAAAAALKPLERSLEIAQEWAGAYPGPETRYFSAIAMSRLGVASQETGDLSRALELFLGALRLIEELLKEQPGNAIWRREQDVMFDRLGWVTGHPQYFNLGDAKAASVWARQLVSDAERLYAADPDNIRSRFDLSEASAALAAITREADPRGAEKLYRRSLDLSGSVLRADPDDAEAAYWQAFNRVGFGWVLRRLGRGGESLAQLESAVSMLERLVQRNPNDERTAEYLGLALHTLADHRLSVGDRAGAERDAGRSRLALEPLYQANPNHLTRLRNLAGCYKVLGDLDASRSRWQAAQGWYRKSLELWARWPEVGTSSIYDQRLRAAAARLAENAAREFAKISAAR